MVKMKALELTESSWLLSVRSGNDGVMRKADDSYIVLSEKYAGTYTSLEDFQKQHKLSLSFGTIIENNDEKAMVGDYATKHSEIFDIKEGDIPSYSKRLGSNDRYAAGYYAINFPKGCQSAFSPRVTTLDSQEWQGPFKTKLESDHAVKIMSEK